MKLIEHGFPSALHFLFFSLLLSPHPIVLAQDCEQKSVDAKGVSTTFSVQPGISYTVKAKGTVYDGSGRQDADAKYAHGVEGEWADIPPMTQQLGPDHLELFMNGSKVDWGNFDPLHEYMVSRTFTSEQVSFKINDLGSYADNGGSLIVELCKTLGTSPNPIHELSYGRCQTQFLSAKGQTIKFKSRPGVTYKVTSAGVFDAGNFWVFSDAKFSRWIDPNPTTWTDSVRNYESLGPTFLELHINGRAQNWGTYSAEHTYSILYTSSADDMTFSIYDNAPGNNSGGLSISVCPVLMSDIEVEQQIYSSCASLVECDCVKAGLNSLIDDGLIDHRIHNSVMTSCNHQLHLSTYSDGFEAGVSSVDQDLIRREGFARGVESIDQEAIRNNAYSSGYSAGQAAIQCPVDGGDTAVDENRRVTICHKTNGKGKTLEVSIKALPAHLRHGDTEGACPVKQPSKPESSRRKR